MIIDLSSLKFSRLTSDSELKEFDCDDSDLNDFFSNESKNFLKQLLAVTYVIESGAQTIAFFCISNDKISVKEISNPNKWELFKSLFPDGKKLKSYPAVKIGRLGVSKSHQRSGIGKLIIDYLIDSFINNNKTGCRYITVDAYSQSLNFYEKTGFKFMTDKDENKDTRLM